MFAHVMTEQLSGYVQNYVAISWLDFGVEQYQVTIKFEWRRKIISEMVRRNTSRAMQGGFARNLHNCK